MLGGSVENAVSGSWKECWSCAKAAGTNFERIEAYHRQNKSAGDDVNWISAASVTQDLPGSGQVFSSTGILPRVYRRNTSSIQRDKIIK